MASILWSTQLPLLVLFARLGHIQAVPIQAIIMLLAQVLCQIVVYHNVRNVLKIRTLIDPVQPFVLLVNLDISPLKDPQNALPVSLVTPLLPCLPCRHLMK